MRLFVAIELNDDVRAHLERVTKLLAGGLSGVNWTKPANLHLTLKFLGETPDERVMEVVDALRPLERSGVMRMAPAHAECFPPRGPVRIVGIGIEGDVDGLRSLALAVDQACLGVGYRLEGRQFTPHITLGRARDALPVPARQTVAAAIDRLPDAPTMLASEFVLMQSTLDSKGAQYSVVARFSLQ